MYPSIYASDNRMAGWREYVDHQGNFAKGIAHMVTSLNGLLARLEEKRIDIGADAAVRARTTFEGMDLHPRIAAVCGDLYRDGHYSQAVLNTSKALVNFVRNDQENMISTVLNS